MESCVSRYREVYVTPEYFYSIDNLKQKLSKDNVIVHAKNGTFRLIKPKLAERNISGEIQLIPDTSKWQYRHQLEFDKESGKFPLHLYTDYRIQRNLMDSGRPLSDSFDINPQDITKVSMYVPKEEGATVSPTRPLTPEEKKIQSLKSGLVVVSLILILMILGLFLLIAAIVAVLKPVILILALSPACYIATMIYESYDAPQVLVLRKFRDEKLLKSFAGQLFVACYYKVSPLLVRLLKNQTTLNAGIKWGLDKWVRYLEAKTFQSCDA